MSEYGVIDTNVKPGKTRAHIITGEDGLPVEYVFHPGKMVKMPAAHAAMFQTVESFKVFDVRGTELSTIQRDHPLQTKAKALVLKPGQVIADLSELKREALIQRAALIPEGHKFKATAKVEDLIEFIKTGIKKLDSKSNAVDVADGDDEGMTGNELDAMLPKSESLFQG